jgi:hypothetical protein
VDAERKPVELKDQMLSPGEDVADGLALQPVDSDPAVTGD